MHQVINSIHNIKRRQQIRNIKTHNYKGNPNTFHYSDPSCERGCCSGVNHPELNSPELKEDSPPPVPSSVCILLVTSKGNNVAVRATHTCQLLVSKYSLTVMKIDSMDSLFLFSLFPFHIWTYQLTFFLWTTFLTFTFLLTLHQRKGPRTTKHGLLAGTLLEEEELPDPAPPAKASLDCPSDAGVDLHPNSTSLHPKRNGRKVVATAHKAVSDGPTWNSIRCAYPTANSQLITSNSTTFFSSSAKWHSKNANLLFN